MEASKILLFCNTTNYTLCPATTQNCNATYDCNLCNTDIKFNESICVDYHIGKGPSYVAIISSIFSCFGSFLIVLAFLIFKDIRKGMAQRIVTALAIADFISAAGYIVGSLNFILHYNEQNRRDCCVFQTICMIQAFVTSWSSMSSFAWTAILALYLYIVLVYQKQTPFNSKYRQLALHLISWVAPGLIVIPFTAKKFLGFAPFAASNWCFVADLSLYSPEPISTCNSSSSDTLYDSLKVLAAGKFWEILTYIAVIVVYSHITIILKKMRRNIQRQSYEPINRDPERAKVERKMIYIPVIFLLLRCWGTIQFFVNIGMQYNYPMKQGCITMGFHTAFTVLGYLQAIGDPGQGWGNALLYIFLSDSMCKRLITIPLTNCCRKIAKKYLDHTEHFNDSGPGRDRENRNQIQNLPVEEREATTVATRPIAGRPISQYSTITDDQSHPGPYDEPARPGPSPIYEVRRREYPSETTSTTTRSTLTTNPRV